MTLTGLCTSPTLQPLITSIEYFTSLEIAKKLLYVFKMSDTEKKIKLVSDECDNLDHIAYWQIIVSRHYSMHTQAGLVMTRPAVRADVRSNIRF